MDRGTPTEAVLAEMRASDREMFYLVGTRRGRVAKYEKQWLELATIQALTPRVPAQVRKSG